MDKRRKTINVSLQSRKYNEPMNELINKWEEDGDNISIQVCETLLKWNEFQQSPTMLRIFNVFELIKKSLELYNIEDENKIEEVLNSVIKFDATGLNEIFLTMSQLQGSNIKKVENIVQSPTTKVEPITEVHIKEDKPITIPTPKVEQLKDDVNLEKEVPFEEDIDIPLDFLING